MRHHFPEGTGEQDVRPPSACPACKSTDLTTTSKTVTSETYWRCRACGEVWNAARLEASSRHWPRYR